MKKSVIMLLMVFLLVGLVAAQDYAAGEVIVKYKDDVVGWGNKVIVDDSLVYYDVAEPVGEERIVEGIELYNLKFDENANILEIAEEYENIAEVEYAEPNLIFTSNLVPNDSSYASLYWTSNVNAEAAWDLTIGNKEVIIAVLDTGVDWNHPDLLDNIVNRSDGCNASADLDGNGFFGDCRGYDFTDINITTYLNAGYNLSIGEDYNLTDNDPMDFDGHGTHVAGIAGAVGDNGVGVAGSCWNCSIMPVRSGFNIITGSGSSVGSLEIDDVAAAIYYAADNGADVISMSFGGGDSSTVRAAIEYAHAAGSILVASSGNSGANSIQYPCGYEEVVCVGATNSDNSPASYSNYGSWVDLAAPGTGVYSTIFDDSYASLSGTSMSTPLVSGLIGIVLSLFDKNQSEVVAALKGTGSEINFSGTIINQPDIYSALLSLDDVAPTVILDSPLDDHSNLTLNQTFVCSGSDWQLSSIRLDVWNSGGLFYNETKIVSGTSNSSSFDLTLGSDSYEWNCFVGDVKGNGAYAPANYSISTTDSRITLDSPSNDSHTNSNLNYFNCSVENSVGKAAVNMTFTLWNASELIHSETRINLSENSVQTTFNYSFSQQGSYVWSCSSYNDLNELAEGDNYKISYDNIEPIVTLNSPASGLSYESNSQDLDFVFNVSETSDCALVVDGSEKDSLNNVLSGTISESFSPADYTWIISCEDDAGNVGISETRSFTVEEPDEEEESSGGGGTGGGGGGGGGSSESSSSTVTTPVVQQPVTEENVEPVVEELVAEEPEIEENLETDETASAGITGNVVEGEGFNLSGLQKYKNRVNIFVVFLLAITGILFYRDYRYELDIAKEMEVLEKE